MSIYFARAGDFVKIGSSSNPTRRVQQLASPNLHHPEGFDYAAEAQLLLVIPFCRRRDELNMHLLFGNHWAAGEWFHWSPAFEYQMRTMQFVTHDVRLKDLRRARRSLGVLAGTAKEWRYGQIVSARLAESHPDRRSA